MGTDLKTTIEELHSVISYYIGCCNPNNKEAIREALEDLKTVLEEG